VCSTVAILPCDASAISAANMFACASARGEPRVPILTVPDTGRCDVIVGFLNVRGVQAPPQ
jgi:hypothetical protein